MIQGHINYTHFSTTLTDMTMNHAFRSAGSLFSNTH